jgi:hypothetical protein
MVSGTAPALGRSASRLAGRLEKCGRRTVEFSTRRARFLDRGGFAAKMGPLGEASLPSLFRWALTRRAREEGGMAVARLWNAKPIPSGPAV